MLCVHPGAALFQGAILSTVRSFIFIKLVLCFHLVDISKSFCEEICGFLPFAAGLGEKRAQRLNLNKVKVDFLVMYLNSIKKAPHVACSFICAEFYGKKKKKCIPIWN